MIFKKKFLLLTLLVIIILQTFLYLDNKQKTSFRYFKWTVQEVSIGKLIGISFFSGLAISALLNASVNSFKKNNFENIEDNNEDNSNEDSNEDINPNIEMPPQRDIREAQPTISVNYRVIKNNEKDNFKSDRNYSNTIDDLDDWDNDDNDW